jgi:hypothetical protein
MTRRRRGLLFAFGLAALAGASCGDATFDLLPAEVRVDAGAGSATGGGAGSAGTDSGGDAGALQPGGQGGYEPPFGVGGAQCFGPDCEQGCAPWDPFCVHCDEESECEGATPFCELNFNRCVECRDDFDCDLGFACDPLSGSCAPSCAHAGNCGDDRPLCDQARGICVECIEDAHCRTDISIPFCVIGKCVECFASPHCPVERPFCDGFACRECFESWECGPDERCDDGACVHDF